MADTYTSKYNLTKIEVGASRDSWGSKVNANMDLIDTALQAVSAQAASVLDNLRASVRYNARANGPVQLLTMAADDFKDDTGLDKANSTNANLDGLSNIVNTAVDPNAKVLCHFEGTKGALSTTDALGNTVTLSGGAAISTDQFKFGVSSVVFNGSTSYITVGPSGAFDYSGPTAGGADFTYECWFFLNSFAGGPAIMLVGGVGVQVNSNGSVSYGSASATAITGGAAALQAWNHLAVVRSGGTVKVYLNGSSVGSTTANYYNSGAQQFNIGSWPGYNQWVNGYIDEFRVSNVARYTVNFTPPAAPFAATGGAPGPMDARSIVFADTSGVIPSKASILAAFKVTSGTLNLNTNVWAMVSRDGGTTWTKFALTQAQVIGGYIFVKQDGLDISAQPSAANMRWRFQTTDGSIVIALDFVDLSWG